MSDPWQECMDHCIEVTKKAGKVRKKKNQMKLHCSLFGLETRVSCGSSEMPKDRVLFKVFNVIKYNRLQFQLLLVVHEKHRKNLTLLWCPFLPTTIIGHLCEK